MDESVSAYDQEFSYSRIGLLQREQVWDHLDTMLHDPGMSILELVQRVGAFFHLDTSVVTPVKSDTLGQPGKRPPRTGFVLDKARKELGYAPRGFEEGLAVLKKQLEGVR